MDRTDGAVPDPLGGLAVSFAGASVVSQLCGDSCLLGDLGDEPGLPDVVGERLLAVDVLAGLRGEDRDVGVKVVRGGDQDGVDRLFLLQHDPEVLVDGALVAGGLPGVGLLDLRLHRVSTGLAAVVVRAEVPLLARVGDGDDLAIVLPEEGAGVGAPLAPDADDGDVHLVTRGDEPRTTQDVAGQDRRGGGRRGGDHELTSTGLCRLLFAHGTALHGWTVRLGSHASARRALRRKSPWRIRSSPAARPLPVTRTTASAASSTRFLFTIR